MVVTDVEVVLVVLAVGSGWLSSFDIKVTFPWEAAWESRGRLSRAAGPPPPREETTEGHQPAGGGGAGAAQVKLGGEEQEDEGASRSAEHRCEEGS